MYLLSRKRCQTENLESISFSFQQVNFLKMSFFPNQLIPNQNTLANNHVHICILEKMVVPIEIQTCIQNQYPLIITIVYT
jgi:ABC-type uncharacterized transport system permease subunit